MTQAIAYQARAPRSSPAQNLAYHLLDTRHLLPLETPCIVAYAPYSQSMSFRPLGAPQRTSRTEDNASLLSPVAYDDDASSVHTRSDQDTDSEDDALQLAAASSRDLAAHDRVVLLEEEETSRLVTATRRKSEKHERNPFVHASNLFSRNPIGIGQDALDAESPRTMVGEQKQARKKKERRRKPMDGREDARDGEDGALIYEMEEGGRNADAQVCDKDDRGDSDDIDRQMLQTLRHNRLRSNSYRYRWFVVYVLIVSAFSALFFGSWKLSASKRQPDVAVPSQRPPLVSNGSALFAPTTILISLDGFRADFLFQGLTPTLNSFKREGVSPDFMLPVFPSVTFPNHYSIATGLHPESHGIVGNSFWDPTLGEEFYYKDPVRSHDPKWWKGEPFWVTAEKQGVRTAIHMWPGSEAHILGIDPSFLDSFVQDEPLSRKVQRILEFVDMPGYEDPSIDSQTTRPQIIAAYVPDVDHDGHVYGPNSTETRHTIERVDQMLGDIFRGLEDRNLTHIVNVIVASDHGMITTDINQLIQLEDLLDVEKIEHFDGWPLVGLRPRHDDDLLSIHAQIAERAKTNPNLDVYLRDVDMPKRYHFTHDERIAPLWIVPKAGWVVVPKVEVDIENAKNKGLEYHLRGNHGYDFEHPLMRAIFVARGPAFPHAPNSKVNVFQCIQVYNLLCDSVGVTPNQNNGTWRLPLTTIGLHQSDNQSDADTTSLSLSPSTTTTVATLTLTPMSTLTPTPTPKAPPPSSAAAEPSSTDGPTDDVVEDNELEKLESTIKGFWDWIKEKVSKTWDKAAS